VVLRYSNANELLVSGLLDNGGELAQHPAVVDASYGEGHVVLFSQQSVLARGTKGQLFPGLQRDPEFRQPHERGEENWRTVSADESRPSSFPAF